jgi:hypothetical protein
MSDRQDTQAFVGSNPTSPTKNLNALFATSTLDYVDPIGTESAVERMMRTRLFKSYKFLHL